MFCGCSIKDKKPFIFKTGTNKIIHLATACISDSSKQGKVYLSLQTGEEKYNLCSLKKGDNEYHKLDLILMFKKEDPRPFILSITGSTGIEIHVTGSTEHETDDVEDYTILDDNLDDNSNHKIHNEEDVKEEIKEKSNFDGVNDYSENSDNEMDDDCQDAEGEDISELLKKSIKNQSKPKKVKNLELQKKDNFPKKENKNKNNSNKNNWKNKSNSNKKEKKSNL